METISKCAINGLWKRKAKDKQFYSKLFSWQSVTRCFFFLQKPYYKLQLALNYWKTCIPMKKEKRKRKEGWTLLCLTQPHSTMIYKCRTTFNSRIFSRLLKLQYMYIETLTNTGTKLFPWGSVKVPYQCEHRRVLKLYLLWLNVLATDKIK